MRSGSYVNTFKGRITNMTGRPAQSWGSVINPGNNTFSTYNEILGNTAYECFGIAIVAHNVGVSTLAKDALLTLGFDHAGGTSYTDNTISNLLVSHAGSLAWGGVWYYFPLYIPAGTAIAARGSTNNATVGQINVGVILYGRPTRPELVRAGAYVDTFGANTAASNGTTVTSGTTSEGSWTEMTSGTTTRPYWWFQTGFGANDSSLGSVLYGMDLAVGDASNKEVVFENVLSCSGGSTEQLCRPLLPSEAYTCDIPEGQRIYTRMQCSGTADSSLSMCAYALGG